MMWKLILGVMVLYVVYMIGQDHGLPEQRRVAALERRVQTIEVYLKAQRMQQSARKAASEPGTETGQ